MKNIIKRGTSLLLVLAMLLSFAAVVGAADERLPVEGEKPVTLSLDSVVLRQGSTDVQYVPVRLTIEPGFAITGFQLAAVSSDESAVEVTGFYPKRPLKIYEDGSVNYDETIGTIFGKLYSNYGSSESKDPVQKFACANGKGVTSETISTRAEDGVIKEPDLAGYIGVKVKDGAQSGAYQLSIIPNASRDRDTTKRNDIVFTIGTQNTYTDAYATLNAGTAIVLPEGASLPTVILTDDTFAVPTWAQMKAGEDIYPLAGRMKIVGTDGKLYAVDPTTLTVEKDSVPTGVSVKNNQLEILTSTLRNDDTLTGTGTLRVTNAKAVGADISVTSATVSFKVNRAPAVATHVGFGYSGYNPVPADATPREAESKTAENVQFNLGYGSLGVFDQYSDSIPGLTPTVDLKLYSDAFQTELQPEDEVITAKQVTMGTSTLTISKDLKKDVWCEIKTSWTNSDGSKTITGDTVKVHITSNYPQPKKAVIKLTDGSGNLFSGDNAKGTFDIPGGSGSTTIKFAVDKFLDKKNNEEMKGEAVPTDYTVAATQTSPAAPADDVTISIDSDGKTGTITVGSGAVKSAPVEITIKVTLADNTELTGILKVDTKELPAKITLKKGNSFATSLASYDSTSKSYVNDEIRADSYEGNALPTVLPGIGGDEASVVLAPLYVLDQYDAVMQMGVAAANYKLYKVDGETKTLISADYAKFEDGIEGRVTLKLTNALAGEEGAKSLALTAGEYQIEATYNNKTATARFTMAEATEKTYVATVTAEITTYGYTGDKSVKTLPVPYIHGGTSQQRQTPEITYTATVTDQYGKTPADGTNVVAAITSIKLGTSQADYINDGSSKFYVTNGTTNAARLQVTSNLADAMSWDAADSVVVHVGLTVTVGGKPATVESVPDYTFTTDEPKLGSLGVYLRTDESVLTALGSWNSNATNNPEALTIVAPAGDGTTRNVLDFAVYDQYRRSNGFAKALTKGWLVKGDLPTGMTFGDKSLTAGSIYEVTVTKDAVGKTFTITAPAATNVAGTDWTVKVTAVAVEFVNGAGEPYTIGKLLDTAKLSKVYNRDTWHQVIEGASAVTGPNDKNSKVYIRGAEGQNNVEVTQKIWAEVIDKTTGQTVYDARDSLANPAGPTASATEKAGTYIVKIFYREKEGDAPIEVCSSGEFTISPKPITIELKDVGQTITKPYDGNTNLPGGLELGPKDTVENDRVNLIPGNLEFAQADVKLNGDGTVDSIPIRVKAGMDCLSGDDAGNYTVELEDGNIKGLTGTINKRTIVVTPKSSDEVNLTYGDDVAEKLASEYTTNIDALPTTCVKPTIEGSMALTKGETEASAPYDAGEYTVALGSLSVGSNYRLELASGTHTWTIGKKTIKFLLTCEREADYGVYGRELYGELETMIASTDAGSKNIKELFDTSKLEFRGSAGTTTVAKTGDVVVDAGAYAVTAESLTLAMSNNYDVQDAQVQITVKKHTIVSDDIKQNGGTQSVTFSGERQTLTNYKVSFTYKDREITLAKNQDFAVLENSNTILDTSTRLKVKAAENSANYEGEATASWSWYILARSVSTDDIEVSQVNVPTYDGNEHQVEIAVNHIGPNKDEAWLKFFTVNNIYFRTGDKATDAGEHTLAFSLTGPYTSGRDVDPSKRLCELRWTIEKSNEKPIGDQTANTKYGQPGSIEIAVSDGVAKGLDTSKLSVSIVTDTDNIISGTPTAKFENGKIVVNWKLKGDATTIGKSATLQVTVAESDNYKEYSFGITVTAAKKDAQDKFFIATEDGRSAYSYSEAGVLMQASGNQGDVTWIMDSEYQAYAEIVDGNYVKFKKPGTVTIKATAKETNDYAAAERTYTLTITKGQVTVSASSATMTANDPLPGFSATASGLNPKDSVSEVFQTLTATVSTDGKTAGTYRVTPNAVLKAGVKDWNEYYELSFVQGTLTVNPAVSVIDTVLPTIIAGNGCANGYANCACESFYDLDASRWYHEAIDWAYNLGLMNGTTKSTFGPNTAATRAQTWTMLARIAGQDTRRSSTWYEVGQKWAMNLGITDGTNPMGSLTREQLAAMLYRYVGSPAVNGTLTFTDSANVSTWARNAMIWAVQNGILDGVGGNRLNPKGTTTRAQAAAIFMRFSKLINK